MFILFNILWILLVICLHIFRTPVHRNFLNFFFERYHQTRWVSTSPESPRFLERWPWLKTKTISLMTKRLKRVGSRSTRRVLFCLSPFEKETTYDKVFFGVFWWCFLRQNSGAAKIGIRGHGVPLGSRLADPGFGNPGTRARLWW